MNDIFGYNDYKIIIFRLHFVTFIDEVFSICYTVGVKSQWGFVFERRDLSVRLKEELL